MSAAKTAVIIGGGIAGPVTALALRRAGMEATVYEAYASSAEGIGGMLTLAPNGLNALAVVGADEVACVGQAMPRMAIGNARGRVFGEFDGIPGLPPSRVMWRSDLYRVLHGCAAAQGVRIEQGRRLVGVEERPDGVTARFADGSTATGDILVGADGIQSLVRTLIDPDAPNAQHIGLLGFGAYSDMEVPGQLDTMYFVFGGRGFLGYWRHPEGRPGTAWFSNLPHEAPMTIAEARAVPAAEWLRQLRDVYGDDVPAHDLLRHTTPDQLFIFGQGEILPSVPHWHRGRMVLVGDSAHAPSSSSGQGASLAAESAVELARCLRDLPDVPSAFAAYERLRRPRVEKIAAGAARTNSQKAAGPVGNAIMSVVMPIAMRTVMRPEKMFGWQQRFRIDWDAPVTL